MFNQLGWYWHHVGERGFAGLVVFVGSFVFALVFVLAVIDALRDARRGSQGAAQGASAESKVIQDPPI
jgi:hypothetical protein